MLFCVVNEKFVLLKIVDNCSVDNYYTPREMLQMLSFKKKKEENSIN